jgi:hypothetical protein
MGYNPKMFPTVTGNSHVPVLETCLEELGKLQDEAMASHELARRRMMDRGSRYLETFKPDDKVWLDARNLNLRIGSKKLAPKREGPFTIKKRIGSHAYKLDLHKRWQIHPVFHVMLLRKFEETDEHGSNYLRPPTELIEGEKEFEVEAIVAHRKIANQMQYLIKWKGYPTSENTWQNTKDLGNAKTILQTYKRRKKIH